MIGLLHQKYNKYKYKYLKLKKEYNGSQVGGFISSGCFLNPQCNSNKIIIFTKNLYRLEITKYETADIYDSAPMSIDVKEIQQTSSRQKNIFNLNIKNGEIIDKYRVRIIPNSTPLLLRDTSNPEIPHLINIFQKNIMEFLFTLIKNITNLEKFIMLNYLICFTYSSDNELFKYSALRFLYDNFILFTIIDKHPTYVFIDFENISHWHADIPNFSELSRQNKLDLLVKIIKEYSKDKFYFFIIKHKENEGLEKDIIYDDNANFVICNVPFFNNKINCTKEINDDELSKNFSKFTDRSVEPRIIGRNHESDDIVLCVLYYYYSVYLHENSYIISKDAYKWFLYDKYYASLSCCPPEISPVDNSNSTFILHDI